MGISTGNTEPENDPKWISVTEAAKMLQLNRDYFTKAAKERGYTRRQAHHNAQTRYLRTEIESWAELRRMRQRWLTKYPGAEGKERWTEKIDRETAQRLFISTKEAGALLGVARTTVSYLVRTGRLVCYQTVPGHRGASVWFSRRAVQQLAEDPERLKRRERYFKKFQQKPDGERSKTPQPFPVRDVPKGWLTTREAAERLGVGIGRVRGMRLTGRLRGEQIWRGNKTLRFWYYPDYEVERAISWRDQAKEAKGQPLLPVPTPAGEPPPNPPAAPAQKKDADPPRGRRTMEYEDLAVAGPEPKWACDDPDLRRAFFLMDRPEI